MRVNIGYLFFVAWVISFVGIYYLAKKRWHPFVTILNLVVCLTGLILLEGISNIEVIPASFIREGLHLPVMSFQVINIALVMILILGIVGTFQRLVTNK